MARSAARPAWSRRAKAVIYLGGDAQACKKLEPVIAGFAEICLYFGPFGASSTVKLVNNLLVGLNIAATAEAMALGLEAGVDVDLMIKAIANGSGGSTQFGIRAPWMAQRDFMPRRARPQRLRTISSCRRIGRQVGVATPLVDCADRLYRALQQMGSASGCRRHGRYFRLDAARKALRSNRR